MRNCSDRAEVPSYNGFQIGVWRSINRNRSPWLAEINDLLRRAELPVPVMPDLTTQLQDLEAWITAYIDRRLDEAIGPSRPLRYPEEPMKDARNNLHLPAGELWGLKAVAASLGLDLSHLLRQVWQAFRVSPQSRQALHLAIGTRGLPTADEEGDDHG